jgi:hypothetical protein
MPTLSEILRPRNDAPIEEIFRCAASLGYHYFAYLGTVYEVTATCIYDRTDMKIGVGNESNDSAETGHRELLIRRPRIAA